MAEQKRNTRNSKSTKIQPVNDYGRIQPQAPELEEAVLGALMIEKDAYSLVSEILRPESFYERRHQLIYSAIVDLAVNQKPVDILTVKEQLSKRGDLEEVGGPFYITQLIRQSLVSNPKYGLNEIKNTSSTRVRPEDTLTNTAIHFVGGESCISWKRTRGNTTLPPISYGRQEPAYSFVRLRIRKSGD